MILCNASRSTFHESRSHANRYTADQHRSFLHDEIRGFHVSEKTSAGLDAQRAIYLQVGNEFARDFTRLQRDEFSPTEGVG